MNRQPVVMEERVNALSIRRVLDDRSLEGLGQLVDGLLATAQCGVNLTHFQFENAGIHCLRIAEDVNEEAVKALARKLIRRQLELVEEG